MTLNVTISGPKSVLTFQTNTELAILKLIQKPGRVLTRTIHTVDGIQISIPPDFQAQVTYTEANLHGSQPPPSQVPNNPKPCPNPKEAYEVLYRPCVGTITEEEQLQTVADLSSINYNRQGYVKVTNKRTGAVVMRTTLYHSAAWDSFVIPSDLISKLNTPENENE